MDVSVIFQFLKDLAANNNREWFQGHKDEYLKAQKEFEELLTAIIARISLFDESIVGIQAKDCTYRIYRDTRFSIIFSTSPTGSSLGITILISLVTAGNFAIPVNFLSKLAISVTVGISITTIYVLSPIE